jgi:hypothetical protein
MGMNLGGEAGTFIVRDDLSMSSLISILLSLP